MPFGSYASKSVQMMSNLFQTSTANDIFRRAGQIGRKGAVWDDIPAIMQSGRRRVGAGAGLGIGIAANRSSGSRGLQPRSSAPPPIDPYSQF